MTDRSDVILNEFCVQAEVNFTDKVLLLDVKVPAGILLPRKVHHYRHSSNLFKQRPFELNSISLDDCLQMN